jgi:hypothetical protein
MAYLTSTKPTKTFERYGRLQFNKSLRSSMARKPFATQPSRANSAPQNENREIGGGN